MLKSDDEKKRTLPYNISPTTIDNLVTELGDTVIPTQINASFLSKKSGTVKLALPTALRFFGLIDSDGVPQPRLVELVNAPEEERQILYKQLFQDAYSDLFKTVDTSKGVQSQLNDWFKSWGLSGNTVTKCNAFFLDFAKMAGVELSPHFKKESGPVRKSPARTKGLKKGVIVQHSIQNDTEKTDTAQSMHGAEMVKVPIPLTPSRTWYVTIEKKHTTADVTRFAKIIDIVLSDLAQPENETTPDATNAGADS